MFKKIKKNIYDLIFDGFYFDGKRYYHLYKDSNGSIIKKQKKLK